MNGKEIFKIYAPLETKWTEWVRPVYFVAIDKYNRKPIGDWLDIKIMFLDCYKEDTAIFVDLPSKSSVEFGISLAKLGYRIIPLFNGTVEQTDSQATIDTSVVQSALINGAEKLKNIPLKNNANPVFLLDSFRTNRYRISETIFDNSWDLYAQDIPTAEYFKQNNIKKIIVVCEEIQRDLKKIFLEFQKKGIEFYLTDGYSSLKKVVLKKTLKEMFMKETE